tara:strand:+ start:1147 stop:1452 length:306 start_codon:yes stop_codon:yes gene_type:complete
MSKLVDYLSTWFVDEDAIQDERERDLVQQAILDRQYQEGKRGFLDYYSLSSEVSGNGLEEYVDENDNPLSIVPWWIWVALIGAAFWYLGGFIWLKGILARK